MVVAAAAEEEEEEVVVVVVVSRINLCPCWAPCSGHNTWCLRGPRLTALDVKRSSHKKLSKLLQAKAKQGWLTVKEDKHTKEMMLTLYMVQDFLVLEIEECFFFGTL